MLRKLYKHEFHLLLRSLFPIYAALGLFAVVCKLTSLIEIDNVIYEAVMGFSTVFYVVSILAMFVVGMVIIVVRFYKNLLSQEGYLTFSLPFTATEHIVCKLICAAAMMLLNGIAVIFSLIIVGLGSELMDEIIEILPIMFKEVFAGYSALSVTLFFIQIFIMIVISMFQSVLMYYTAMAIGQQFRNKIGGSVIAYIGLYVATETFSTITILPLIFIYGNTLNDKLNSGNIMAIQGVFLYAMVLSLILGLVYFFITRHFLSKKLNLE